MSLKKTLSDHLSEFEGRTPIADQFARLVQIVYEAMPGKIPWPTLEASLMHLAGARVTRELIEQTAWRLAGNVKRLQQHRVVPPWHIQKLEEWVPLQVLSCRYKRMGKKIGAIFSFRIMAGTSCPLAVWKWWSLRQCAYFAPYFGFSKPGRYNARTPPKYPYTHPAQLVTLRLYGMIDPELCEQEPAFSLIAWPPTVAEWNRTQIKHRFRIDEGYTCPKGYHATFECHRCPIGYLKCRAGTHRKNWETRLCSGCDRPDAMFDPDIPSDVCVDCQVQAVYRGE